MTKYDFTTIPQRRHTDSIKWAVQPNELPMWIADMDFQTAPEIKAAMMAKIQTGIFGYEEPHDDYYQAVIDWYQQEHQATAKPDWLIFTTGVVPALSASVRRLSHVGDNVLVQAPVYNIFYNSIVNNGRHVLSSDLVYQNGQYQIDFKDLAAQLAKPLTTLMILCNPHNPVGKVWTEAELLKIRDLCAEHHVTLISDEIHGDLVLHGPDYRSLFSLADAADYQTVSLVSPSKTFNVAALHAATAIVPNAALRDQVIRGLNTDEVAEPNLLALPGTIAAYTQGHAWLAALKDQLRQNYQQVATFLAANLPEIKLVASQATYLVWLDCSALKLPADELAAKLRAKTGLILSAGSIYGGNGDHFLRMNIACPASMVRDGLERLKTGIKDKD
ncbi:MalY/PatB family protein [Lapidilactobacillus wuchangensis]|uniref:MalY/PatB family protein n=1 Tax=Lapidilactobacillus wuchangensis TaxID=2486001 RepID=UPI000F7B71D8|nr:MalY/PatB family protein [Lapidilactobacillus wuchangensis]